MGSPIAHHQHLHGGWRVTGDRKELLGARRFSPFLAIAHANLFRLEFHGFIDFRGPRRLSLDLKSLRREIVGASKSGSERNCRSPVNKFEGDFRYQRLRFASGVKSFFADRLLKFMENEFAALDHFRLHGLRL